MTTSSQLDVPEDVRQALTEWVTAPTAHPRVGDWRRAGFRRGAWPPAKSLHVVRACERGIDPGDGNGLAERIQQELEVLAEGGGGVLELEEGRYVLDRPILIHGSHVVLRGAGSGKTTLFFTRPLVETLGEAPLDESTGWSWNGGNVFFISRERLAESTRTSWAGFASHKEGWLLGDTLSEVGASGRGEYRLTLSDPSAVVPGEMVALVQPVTPDHVLLRSIAGDVAGAGKYDWVTRAATIAGLDRYPDFDDFVWPVRVLKVEGNEAILEQPLKLTVDAGSSLRVLGPTVHDSGVEGLTIENALLIQTAHNLNPGSNGVGFQAVHDCWASDIHVINSDLAFGLTSAKSCQLSGVSAGGRSLHHFVACRVQSHDNLVEDFRLDEFDIPAVPGSYLHGINVEGLSSGNVYRRGVMHTGTFDSHRQLPFENLRTDITITNKDAVPGGALNGGPYFGARNVNWSIAVTNGNNLCMDIVDIAPSSLTAGITGLQETGSVLPRGGMDFEEPLESERLAFGIELSGAPDLLEVQRALAPIH